MPGVTIGTNTRSGPVNPTAPQTGRYFVVGMFERGLVGAPILVRSMAELEVACGSRVSYGSAYDDLRCYFEEGGTEAYVSRVVGPAATKGTLTLVDALAAPTLRVDAASPGAWSTGVTVQVTAGTTASTFAIVVDGPLAGDTATYDNLGSNSDAVAALLSSPYVRAADLGEGDPAVAAAAALSAGTDDRAAVTSTHLLAALDAFGLPLGSGCFSIPGYASTVVGAGAMAWAKDNRRLYLGATPVGASKEDALTAATDLAGADGEHGGIFYPWVRIPLGGGASKLISPEGYVAACRARSHRETGPWAAPAGDVAIARFVVDVERQVDRVEGDALNEGNVSVIRTIAGRARLYGWRSLSTDTENYRLLNGRDVLNALVAAADVTLERHVFKTIDGKGQRLAAVAADLVGLVEPYRSAGGLFERFDADGNLVDPGYSVDVGPAVNTVAVLGSNTIAAVLAVRVSPIGELVNLTIVKAGLTASV